MQFEHFDINQLNGPRSMCITGREIKQVHNFLLHILAVRNYSETIVVVPPNNSTQFYKQIFDQERIHEDIPDNIFRCANMNEENPRELLLILDNYTSRRNDQIFDELIYSGRHYNISTILVCQDLLILPPCVRLNIDHYFLLKNVNTDEALKIFKICDYVGNFEDFYEMFENVTNYGIMTINNCGAGENFLERIFLYSFNNFINKIKSARTSLACL